MHIRLTYEFLCGLFGLNSPSRVFKVPVVSLFTEGPTSVLLIYVKPLRPNLRSSVLFVITLLTVLNLFQTVNVMLMSTPSRPSTHVLSRHLIKMLNRHSDIIYNFCGDFIYLFICFWIYLFIFLLIVKNTFLVSFPNFKVPYFFSHSSPFLLGNRIPGSLFNSRSNKISSCLRCRTRVVYVVVVRVLSVDGTTPLIKTTPVNPLPDSESFLRPTVPTR